MNVPDTFSEEFTNERLKFIVRYTYFKPDSGKYYSEFAEIVEKENIYELGVECRQKLLVGAEWPGLSTRGNFDVLVAITTLDETASQTFLFKTTYKE